MDGEFNKKIMFDNISFMLKEFGKKIGELEAEAGVSPGYISRASKDGSAKPGIDFVVKAAEALGTSIDTLISVDMTSLTPTELYLLSFLEKLRKDTTSDKLEWNRESADFLNRQESDINGYVNHPLFSYETFFEEGETEYPDEVSRVVMISHAFDCHTHIAGDCFNLRMKNGAMLYFMNISKSVYRMDDKDAHAKEIWIYNPGSGTQFLCSNYKNSIFGALIDDLYMVVAEACKRPKIKPDLRYVIDSFMKDDLSDDEDGALPF
ncbi:helix-turn-helix transcriptional regulator [Pygmaiobacter massiliensis]|uniref:helix-turn-helix domain-containing protein n=1 Tax=Pygmaiobacter massiliensis TaxID=1917873 RepID=UPI002A81D58B|nr:helix-turn-helix transcriptional regulator [Pygmaiobacter massiliensis]MDY4784091.1 helix-turn-helix transcriptional regulator [Pygmaiobacter massiliensis]